MQPPEAGGVGQVAGQARIDVETIILVRPVAPLRESTADGVGADDVELPGQRRGDGVEIPAGSREAVPHDEAGCAGLAPLHVVDLAALGLDVTRSWLAVISAWGFSV